MVARVEKGKANSPKTDNDGNIEELEMVEEEDEKIQFEALTDDEVRKVFRKVNAKSSGSIRAIHAIAFTGKERGVFVDFIKRGKGGTLASYSTSSHAIRHFIRGRPHLWRKFEGPGAKDEALSFLRDPSVEQTRQKEKAEQTKEEREKKSEEIRDVGKTFWDPKYTELYQQLPLPESARFSQPQQQQQQQQQQVEGAGILEKIEEAIAVLPCDARSKLKKDVYRTYSVQVPLATRKQKEGIRRYARCKRLWYNAILGKIKEDEKMIPDFQWRAQHTMPPGHTRGYEAYLRDQVCGNPGEITPAVMNLAKYHPARGRTLEEVARDLRKELDSVPRSIFWSAMKQVMGAYDSNIEKIKKAKREGRPFKKFNVKFRRAGAQEEIIIIEGETNLFKIEMPTEATNKELERRRTEAKVKRDARDAEKRRREQQLEKVKKAFQEELKKKNDGKWHFCEEVNRWYRWTDEQKMYTHNVRGGKAKQRRTRRQERQQQRQNTINAAATATDNAVKEGDQRSKRQQKKKYFIARFSNRRETGELKNEVLYLCASKKVVDQIFAVRSDKFGVVQKRIRYNGKTGSYGIDIIVKVEKTSAAEGEEKCGTTDLGIKPLQTSTSADGKIELVAASRDPLLEKREKIDALASKIARRDYDKSRKNGNNRTRTQYRRTTRTLKKKLVKMRQKLKRFTANYHYTEIKTIFTSFDTLILNRLKVQNIAKESKERGQLCRTARKNMYTIAPGYFADRLEHVACRTPGKKIVYGCGEQWTSKTCTWCGKVNKTLGMSKSLVCSYCGLTINRDVNGACNNFKEVIPKILLPNGERRPPPEQQQQQNQEEQEPENDGVAAEGEEGSI